MGRRGATYRNYKRMTLSALVEQMFEKEVVEIIHLWGNFVGKKTCA